EVDAIVTSLGTDQVPAAFGAYPKFIGRYARDRKLMPMETAIHKITGKPAERMRISDRGTIEEGKIADLVVFDPKTILDTNTIAEPTKAPVGIHQVWMDGKLVLEDGERRNEDYRGSILLY
ncbi:MAG: amidohydrolase family protein, partial [Spirochaetales bacterium]|nr:amidohydrolase family protein [Spirochaetales bacterium]